jgi:hypothetical protein
LGREHAVAGLRHAEYYRRVLVSAETMVQKGGENALAGLSCSTWSASILAGEAWQPSIPPIGRICSPVYALPDR